MKQILPQHFGKCVVHIYTYRIHKHYGNTKKKRNQQQAMMKRMLGYGRDNVSKQEGIWYVGYKATGNHETRKLCLWNVQKERKKITNL